MSSLKENSIQFLKMHWLGILLSVVIGVIVAAPPVVWHFSSENRGFPMLKTNTEPHYVSEVKEVMDGQPSLGNPFFSDLKGEPYLFPPLGPWIMGAIGLLFQWDVMTVVMVLRFVFVTLLSFCIYFFATKLSGNRLVGYVAAPFVILGYSLVDPSYILAILRTKGLPAHVSFIDYGRPINPQLSSLFFFGYLVFLWQTLFAKETRRERLYGVFAAILLGASFYVYLFTWTFIFSLNGFLVLVYSVKKDWQKVKRIIVISLVAGVIGIPYVLHTLEVSRHPWYQESAVRFGFVKTHAANISKLILGLFFVFILLFRRLPLEIRRFFLAFFLTAIFVVNEQVITGQFVYNHHYHWYYNTPLAILFLCVILFLFLDRLRFPLRSKQIVTGIVVLSILVHGIFVQTAAYARIRPELVEEQRYTPLIAWLNTETQKDSTVFASPTLTNYITALTHNNVNYHGTGIYTLVPDARLLHEYLLYTYLLGVKNEDIRSYLEAHRSDISAFAFGYRYSFIPGVCYGCFPDSVIDEMVEKYQEFSDQSFISEIQKYPTDYIVWDKKNDPTWQLGRFGFSVAVEFGDITTYLLTSN